LFRLLTPEKYTGVNLSPSNILIPIKSVSAILGLSDEGKVAKPQKCGICSLRQSCEFRKRGTICGNS
jgi:vitamin B12 dependent methionine synthase, activation domain